MAEREFEVDGDAAASARVTVVLEITSDGHWGKDASIAEVRRIGGREAIAMLQNALIKANVHNKIRIVGTPEVGVVVWKAK